MTAWSASDAMNPPGRWRGGGKRSAGGGGGAGLDIMVATVVGTYPAHGRRGTASRCAPTRQSQTEIPRLLRSRRLTFRGRREPDHLNARALGDVHRLDHVAVGPVRRRLDEHQLGDTLVEDVLQG